MRRIGISGAARLSYSVMRSWKWKLWNRVGVNMSSACTHTQQHRLCTQSQRSMIQKWKTSCGSGTIRPRRRRRRR